MKFIPLLCPIALIASAHAGETRELTVTADCVITVIRVQAGAYTQGSPESEAGRKSDETARRVTLTRDFELARTPVTRAQFHAFVSNTGYRTEAEKGKSGGFGLMDGALKQAPSFNWKNPGFAQTGEHPVVIITHGDALAFCKWVSAKTGRTCRLPSEAEWEYACRAGSSSAWYDARGADAVARHRGTANPPGTAPVGQLAANEFGFTDMPGHVREWCADWYAARDASETTDPLQSTPPANDKPRRVLRGASFLQGPEATRSAARGRADPGSRNADTGFRILLELPEPAPAVTAAVAPTPAADMPQATFEPPALPPNVTVTSAQFPSGEFPAAALPSAVSMASGPSIFGFFPLIFILAAGVVVVSVLKKIFASNEDGSGHYRRIIEDDTTGTADNPFEGDATSAGVTLTNEGFWLAESVAPRGATIHYAWFLNGQAHPGMTVFTPGAKTGGHFVYTGARPDRVVIREIVPGDDADQHPFDTDSYTAPRDNGDSFNRGVAAGWTLGQTTSHHHHTGHNSGRAGSVFTSRPSAY